jgi:hypothetical protein
VVESEETGTLVVILDKPDACVETPEGVGFTIPRSAQGPGPCLPVVLSPGVDSAKDSAASGTVQGLGIAQLGFTYHTLRWFVHGVERAAVGMELKDDDLVFRDLEGRPLRPDTVTHAWVKLVRRIGLRGIRLHDARHTHPSLMLKQGVHLKIVQERLGHASIQLTLDTYSHVVPGLQEAAAAGFDKMISVAPEKETAETHY